MTAKKSSRAARPKDDAGPTTASEAWREVLARMGDLGDAMEQWTKAAVNEADAKQKLDQVRMGISDIAQKADAAFGQAQKSELGQHVKEGAEQVGQAFGEAAQRVSDATAPHVKDAFAGLSDVFGKAAAKVNVPRPPHSKPAKRHAGRKAPSKKG